MCLSLSILKTWCSALPWRRDPLLKALSFQWASSAFVERMPTCLSALFRKKMLITLFKNKGRIIPWSFLIKQTTYKYLNIKLMFLPHPLCKLLYDQLSCYFSYFTFIKPHKYSSNLDFWWTHQTWGDLGYYPLLFTSVWNEVFQKAVIPQRWKSWWKVMLPGWGTKLSFLTSCFLKFGKSVADSFSSLRRCSLCCKAVQEPFRVRHTTYISYDLSLCPLYTEFLSCFEDTECSCPLRKEYNQPKKLEK